MAKLTAAQRRKLSSSQFGLPGKARTAKQKAQSGNYPMGDRTHAANAKSQAAKAVAAGRMSRATEAKIDAKANRVLGKGKGVAKGKAKR